MAVCISKDGAVAGVRRKVHNGKVCNICFDCAKAVGGPRGCSWANEFKIIEGSLVKVVAWDYSGEHKRRCDARGYCEITYSISECPSFKRDEREQG